MPYGNSDLRLPYGYNFCINNLSKVNSRYKRQWKMLKFVEIIRKTLRDVKSFAKNIKLRIRFASLKEECLVLVSFCTSQITTVICYLSSDNVAIQQPQRSSLSWGKGLLDALELLPWAGLGFALCNMLLTAGTSPGADIRVLFPKQPRPILLYFIIFQHLSTT